MLLSKKFSLCEFFDQLVIFEYDRIFLLITNNSKKLRINLQKIYAKHCEFAPSITFAI